MYGKNRVALEKAVTVTALSCLFLLTATTMTGVAMKRIIRRPPEAPLCACGCGLPVKWNRGNHCWYQYGAAGHNQRNHKATIQTRLKMSLSSKGKPKSEAHCLAQSKARYKYYETHDPWPLGKTYPIEVKIKQSNSLKCYCATHPYCHSAERNPAWRGGICNFPYPFEWKKIKAIIKRRDKHTCQLPSCKGTDLQLHVHHIDYNKSNCQQSNLITLCRTCHCRTSWRRNQYQKMFTKLMQIKGYT